MAGHIDGTGIIQSVTRDETAVWYKIQAGADILRYVVEKGSITIDGISLTVARVDSETFSVSIIPHTQSNTILADRKVGDRVNLETDIIGKYVEKLLQPQEKKRKQDYHGIFTGTWILTEWRQLWRILQHWIRHWKICDRAN